MGSRDRRKEEDAGKMVTHLSTNPFVVVDVCERRGVTLYSLSRLAEATIGLGQIQSIQSGAATLIYFPRPDVTRYLRVGLADTVYITGLNDGPVFQRLTQV